MVSKVDTNGNCEFVELFIILQINLDFLFICCMDEINSEEIKIFRSKKEIQNICCSSLDSLSKSEPSIFN